MIVFAPLKGTTSYCGCRCYGPGKGLASMPGLVTVDGVTVTEPLFEGLSNGITDIPTIFQTQVPAAVD